MYSDALIQKIANVVAFEDDWDSVEFPPLDPSLTATTESGQYFHQFNENVRVRYIAPTLDQGRDINEYLTKARITGINQVLNTITTQKQLENAGRSIVSEDVVMNVGTNLTALTNEGNFVGVTGDY
jgi:hypothetical protein